MSDTSSGLAALPPPVWAPTATYPPGYGPPPGQPVTPGFVLVPLPTPAPFTLVRPDPVVHLPLAPWWKRLVAVVLDAAVVAVPYIIVIVLAAGRSSTESNPGFSTSSGVDIVASVLVLGAVAALPYALYAGLMNGSSRGQTLGKRAMRIAVRHARTGGRLGFWRGIARTLMAVLFEYLVVIPFLLDALWPLWDDRRQSWHDKVVRSIVVDLDP